MWQLMVRVGRTVIVAAIQFSGRDGEAGASDDK